MKESKQSRDKKIRVLDHSWHLSHQYDLVRTLLDDCKFTWLIQHRRGYNQMPRGDFIKKFDVDLVPYYEKDKYDVAILHLDQQCVEDTLWDRGKGSLYKELNETIVGIPKIVLIHGTPYYPEMYNDIELCRRFRKVVGDSQCVMNSYTARIQWTYGLINAGKIKEWCKENNRDYRKTEDILDGAKVVKAYACGIPLKQTVTIWHGIHEDDFEDRPKDPRVVTMIGPAGLDKYYDRNFLQTVKDMLDERSIRHCHITKDISFKNFNEYKRFLGGSLVYFNPTKESCMPRARTEAMLSGCCVVTTDNQDEEKFIESGKNGFIVERNPVKVVDLIEGLLLEYSMAEKIGQEGKKTALELFNPKRYKKEWLDVINKTINL